MTLLRFSLTDAQKSVSSAAGITTHGLQFVPCPMDTGDIICFPDAPELFYRIASRCFVAQRPPLESEWLMILEPCQDPLSRLAPPQVS